MRLEGRYAQCYLASARFKVTEKKSTFIKFLTTDK